MADPPDDPSEVLTRWAPPPATTVRYGDRPDHVADVWWPAASGADQGSDLVIVIHGGFWRARYTREEIRPMCAALAAAGYVVTATEYRRTGLVGGGWPGTLDDIRAGLEALPGLVSDAWIGAGHLGRTRLIGHSAGGHLALWAGSQVTVPGLSRIVSLGGVCDLARADELGLGAQGDRGAVDAFLGGSPAEQPGRYGAADPMRLPPPGVPVVLIHGTEDTIVPVELSRRYAAYAAAAGAQVELVELAGMEHFGPIDPLSPAWPTVLAALAG
ncbi:MAG: alpha/beta hydrolase [Actinomycetota bacterium]|nr:alpha/beta hydrolase [Actinomycetota bacterium]